MSGAGAAIAALIAAEGLPASYRATIEAHWRPLAAGIAARAVAAGRPLIVGVSGSQGSGKSTLCRMLEELLAGEHGLHAATLSLDDLYLTRSARADLARTVHPLFATRGVPGTHDVALGLAVLAGVRAGQAGPVLPRFDKASDDRAPESAWPAFAAPVDVLLFEGWCMGARPQAEADLVAPINRLEAEEDAQSIWRAHVNAALAGPYRALFDAPDVLVMLQAPGFDAVLGWRQLQEAKLRARTGGGMSDAQLARFVMHYERLTRHLLADLPPRADILIPLAADHTIGTPRY
ncbi:kinase [Novosphingobium fuchskuhlense]|uniref:Kinase n=1 Tax=Novosphingobium fuchskuhlense TaxID=1117702 RepID=A0A117UTA6_9SPHN|nr:kinase [Novosphingobium fuchskuhlense]KUR70437.1 kinase [Novosphingobium fuchskuhlense]